MNIEKDEYKIIATGAAGAILGLALGTYIWKIKPDDRPLSERLKDLTNVVKQFEGINTEKAGDIKERIKSILQIIESNYGNTKK